MLPPQCGHDYLAEMIAFTLGPHLTGHPVSTVSDLLDVLTATLCLRERMVGLHHGTVRLGQVQ